MGNKQGSLKPKHHKKLIGINSAQDYNYTKPKFLAQSNTNIDNPYNGAQNLLGTRDYIEEKELEQEELLSGNPEDCKDTIFSGEGEILASAGETKFEPKGKSNLLKYLDPENLSNEEMIAYLQKENKDLKEYLRKILRLFSTFKSKVSIPIKTENIKLPNNSK